MLDEVREFLAAQLALPAENILGETPLTDLGVDSMKLLLAICEFESAFGVRIPDRRLEELSTVGDLADELAAQRGAEGGA